MVPSMRARPDTSQPRTRRSFVGGLLSVALCPLAARAARAMPATAAGSLAGAAAGPKLTRAAYTAGTGHYGPVIGEPFPVPAVNLSQIDPAFLMRAVPYAGNESPGTIVINPSSRYLYLVQEGGRALRYGVGVGREGFGWSGAATIKSKQEWPDWYPPAEMIARQPELQAKMSALQSGIGMPGGPGNPLGARAMYLWQGNKDTLYRVHGTVEPWTIGKRVSSGCIRMINQDAIDLYGRVPLGTQVIVLGSAEGEIASRQHRAIERGSAYDPSFEASDPYGDQGGGGAYRQGNAVGDPLRLQGADPYQQGLSVDPYGRPIGRYPPYSSTPPGAPYGYGGYGGYGANRGYGGYGGNPTYPDN
ncbi:MAG: L,D-transpeptidase [Hyphomicrobiales bacterium]|nr:L,D-transpeptidase [Hyphomicrobiales bacterium]